MSGLVIIPDVHGRPFWREAVRLRPEEEFIFLGDYLDPYPDEGITGDEALEGLLKVIDLKKRNPDRVTLLWGNHDLHYMYPEMMGSRYDFGNAERNARLFWDNQTLFKMAYETVAGGRRFLFSHAGVGMGWIRQSFPGLAPEELTAELFNDLVGYPRFMEALGDVSFHRWGNKPWGSMVWADVQEQGYEENQLPGVVQVFGHTLIAKPFNFDDRVYCLDCRRCFRLDYHDGLIHDLTDGTPVSAISPSDEDTLR